MAVALKIAVFRLPHELAAFAADSGNNVTTIVTIEVDGSGRYVLFYT